MIRTSKMALGLLLVVLAGAAGAVQTSVQKQSGDDLYAAGASVQVSQPVAGDAVVAGATVLFTGEVAQDVLAAGGSVTVTRAVADDIRAAGGSITVTDRIGGDAVLAGGSVTLAPGSTVAGNVWTAAGVVHLSGAVEGDVEAAGGEVIVGGRIDGDANILAESLEVRAGAVITGTLHHRGPRPPSIAEDAEVGEVVYTERRFEGRGISWLGGLFALLLVMLSLAVCTLLLVWLMPNVSREAARNSRARMLLSLGVGLLTVIATPLIASALFTLVLTTPIAVALLASYVVVLIGGSLVAVACLGAWIRDRFMSGRGEGAGRYALSVLAAALVYGIVALIPFIGVLIVLLAFVTGVGGLILVAARLYKKPADPQPMRSGE